MKPSDGVQQDDRTSLKWPLLLMPLALSLSVWIVPRALFRDATGSTLEQANYGILFLDLVLFAATGPLTGVVLTIINRNKTLSAVYFIAPYLLVTSPLIAFQTVYGIYAVILALCAYCAFSVISYVVQAKSGLLAATLVASALSVGTLIVGFIMVIL